MITEINVQTGEIVEREMNADELAQWEADKAAAEAKAEKVAAKEAVSSFNCLTS